LGRVRAEREEPGEESVYWSLWARESTKSWSLWSRLAVFFRGIGDAHDPFPLCVRYMYLDLMSATAPYIQGK